LLGERKKKWDAGEENFGQVRYTDQGLPSSGRGGEIVKPLQTPRDIATEGGRAKPVGTPRGSNLMERTSESTDRPWVRTVPRTARLTRHISFGNAAQLALRSQGGSLGERKTLVTKGISIFTEEMEAIIRTAPRGKGYEGGRTGPEGGERFGAGVRGPSRKKNQRS